MTAPGLCGAVDVDTFSDPQSPGGTRRVCELPPGHDGSHTAFSGPGHLPCYWWPARPVVDLPAAQEALEQAAFAAFVASTGDDPDVVREAILAAAETALIAFPEGSDAYEHFCIVLNAIAEEGVR